MKTLIRRSGIAVGLALLLLVVAPASAFAQSWDTRDTDSLNRSTPSQNAYTTGSWIKWQDEDLSYPTPQIYDGRVEFRVKLNLSGAKNSCARLRIITYKWSGANYAVSKRFPASSSTNYGYYTYCQADGNGSRIYTGSDVLDVGYGSYYHQIRKAAVSICYSKSKSVPPGGDCHKFTVKYGD